MGRQNFSKDFKNNLNFFKNYREIKLLLLLLLLIYILGIIFKYLPPSLTISW